MYHLEFSKQFRHGRKQFSDLLHHDRGNVVGARDNHAEYGNGPFVVFKQVPDFIVC